MIEKKNPPANLPAPDRTCKYNTHEHCLLTISRHHTRLVRMCGKLPGCGYEKTEDREHA